MEERLKGLEVVSGIVERVENEINQLKIWIKNQKQFALNEAPEDQKHFRIESVCSVAPEKDNEQNTNESTQNKTHFSVGNQPVVLENLLMSHLLGEAPKRPSNTPTPRPESDSDSDDSDIQIIEDQSPREPSNKNPESGGPETNPQSLPDPPEDPSDEFILGDNFSFDIDEPDEGALEDSTNPISSLASLDAASSTRNNTTIPINSQTEEATKRDSDQIPTIKKKRKKRIYADLIKQLKLKSEKESTPEPSSSSNQPRNRPFKCGICFKGFTAKPILKMHLQIHEDKNYNCKYCQFTCHTQSSLYVHISRLHREKNGRNLPFPCPQDGCNLRFLTESAAQNHQKEKHLGLKCPFCEQKHFSKISHRWHVEKIHKFCMNLSCRLQFPTLNALLLHKKRVHNRQGYD